MTKPPCCCWCGGPIRKRTILVHIVAKRKPEYNQIDTMFSRYIEVGDNWPKTKADCQKLTNKQVVSVSYSPKQDENYNIVGTQINRFGEWDGVSYEDEFFCNGDHAKRFGYLAASKGWKRKLRVMCEECGKNPADLPSRICPGCEAYREHQQ